MNLSPHFTLETMRRSETASRKGLANNPGTAQTEALQALCVNVLEPLWTALGAVVITSAFRSLLVNKAVGSGPPSQHVKGEAADLVIPGVSLDKVYNHIFKNLPFDQLIREFPPDGWVHVSYSRAHNRGNGLLASRQAGKVVYAKLGLIGQA